MNVALYIRVSTEEQIEYSPEAQKKLLLEYAKKNGYIVKKNHIFIDEGISGRFAEKRPAFLKMIGMAKSKTKPFKKILVWKFSRFARNQQESILYKNMLRKDGIEVISISEPVIEGPFGDLIERIIEWMDEYYSIRLSGEVMRGMSEKARRGIPQNEAPYGYKLVNQRYEIVPDEAKVIQFIFNEVANGKKLAKICRQLRENQIKSRRGCNFTSRRLKYMIQNPAYIGKVRWNYTTHSGGRKVNDPKDWIISDGQHTPIIDEQLYKEANLKLMNL